MGLEPHAALCCRRPFASQRGPWEEWSQSSRIASTCTLGRVPWPRPFEGPNGDLWRRMLATRVLRVSAHMDAAWAEVSPVDWRCN